jgi:hypothetical protein
MSTDVLIGVHSYRKGIGGKEEREVREDRLEKTQEVAEKVSSMGFSVEVVFLGGYMIDGRTTGEINRDIASQMEHIDLNSFETYVADKYGGDTEAEVDSFIEYIGTKDAQMVLSISSQDHTPRLLRLWNQNKDNVDPIVSVIASEGMYSESELQPFILEGSAFNPFVEVLDKIFSIDSDKREEAAREIEQVLDKY